MMLPTKCLALTCISKPNKPSHEHSHTFGHDSRPFSRQQQPWIEAYCIVWSRLTFHELMATAVIENSIVGRQLFVGNLPFIVAWQDLKDLFRSVGLVLRANIMYTREGRSRGYGTVLFATKEEAQTAIEKFNGYEWHGRKLEVREDRSIVDIAQVGPNGEIPKFTPAEPPKQRDSLELKNKEVNEDVGDENDESAVTARQLYVGNVRLIHSRFE